MKKIAALCVLLAAFPSQALLSAETRLIPLWSGPVETVGEKILPLSSEYRLAKMEGREPKGRVGRLDPANVISVQALAALAKGAEVDLPSVGGEKLRGVINLVQQDKTGWVRVGGALSGAKKGSFAFGTSGKGFGGQILLPEEGLAYEIVLERDGQLLMREKPLAALVCSPIPLEPSASAQPEAGAAEGPVAAPPLLSSRPTASAVIYLDFDGETVIDPLWNSGNPIVAAAPALTASQITSIWESVKEDFLPFDIDVTTNVSRYNNASVGSRMRCIITPTRSWYGAVGGVAYLFSFSSAGFGSYSPTIPCWVFNTSLNGISEAISHEIGHTVGLHHDGGTITNERTTGGSDGNEYYIGYSFPTPTWAPIMGAGYNRSVVQWSKGEYNIANNTEDDLDIISGVLNGFGYALDEAGGTPASATTLNVVNNEVLRTGVIAGNGDVDCFRINAGNGTIKLTVSPAPEFANLDVSAELLDEDGGVLVASGANVSTLSATFSRNVSAGTYFLRVRGAGWASPASGGWSSYGSMGAYTVSGTVSSFTPVAPPVITSGTTASGFVGFPFAYQILATNAPSSYAVNGSLPPGVSLDSNSGLISGTPSVEGTYPVTIRATNIIGTGTQALQITIEGSEDFDLGEALDATEFDWQTNGNADWFPQTVVRSDGQDAAQSGVIGNNESSTLQVDVVGPATISFRWRVDSEANKDYLSFLIDEVNQNRISGKTAWELRTYNVGPGSHTLKWVYAKDYSVALGADAGWVDTFTVSTSTVPVITSPETANATVGQAFSYQIAATNSPTSYSVTGDLPPGLSLNASTGKITGTPSLEGPYVVTIGATNGSGTGTAVLTINVAGETLTLAEAVDAEALEWTTGGDAPWNVQTVTTYDGVDAVRSGKLGNNQESWIETTVTGPSTVSFRWSVDSEGDHDFLRFQMDGTNQASISGKVNWQQRTFPVPAGTHTLRWLFKKDSSIAVGADIAWLDTVTFGTQSTRVIALSGSLAFGNVQVGASAQRTLTIGNTGGQTLTVSSISFPSGFSGNWSGTVAAGGTVDVPVTFLPSVAQTYTGTITVNSNATEGVAKIGVSGVGVNGSGAVFAAQDVPKQILDRKNVSSTVVVSGQPTSIALNQIKLNVGITHTAVGDLIVTLKPPKGAELVIRRRVGGEADDMVISGLALPSNKTINPNGVWKISVEDRKKDNAGALQGWSLLFP